MLTVPINRKLFAGLALFTAIVLVTLSSLVQPGTAELPRQGTIVSLQEVNQILTASCKQDFPDSEEASSLRGLPGDSSNALTLGLKQDEKADVLAQQSSRGSGFRPRQQVAIAHSTNYGPRFPRDITGRPVNNAPIVVLHETVGSASGTIGYFQTPHPRDEDQVSYHTLITLRGTIVYLVPPEKRAFGAGNSVFRGESVRTNPKFPGSVNNFAYHISLETPSDGMHNGRRHSGYTDAQYQALGWLVARTGVPDERITTHRGVDRSGSRQDPRSFNQKKFAAVVNRYPRRDEIGLTCAIQPSSMVDPDTHTRPDRTTSGNAIGQ